MARKKWVIWENIKRTPEERKWVEEQLNKERTPEELKRAILKLEGGARTDYGANWNVWFDKRIGAKLMTCVSEPEIYFKEADEEGEYADNHFSELKRGFIDIIKQNPQDWEIKEYKVSACMYRLPQGEEWKPRDMVVTNWYKSKNGPHYSHYKNGFTKEEWAEIEKALNYKKDNLLGITEEKNNSNNNKDKSEKKDSPENSPSNSDEERKKALIENLKKGIKTLEVNRNRTSAQEAELAEKKRKLRELENPNSDSKPDDNQKPKSDNKLLAGLVIGGAVFVVVGGLIAVLVVLVVRSKYKRKKVIVKIKKGSLTASSNN